MRRALPLLTGAAAIALLLAACSAGDSGTPDFRPSPNGPAVEHSPGVQISPIMPVPSFSGQGGGGGGGVPGAPGGGGSTSKPGGKDPAVVATKLRTPVGLTLLPDGSALVGERTTGRIVHVQPQPGMPTPTVRTLPGLDAAGDGGLLDLALSPNYDEDSLIFAYVTTAKDNRVVAFTEKGPVTPVVTGIPKGRSGNTGRLTFTADGTLAVGTGDAGRPSLAADPKSLAGKVLRVSDIGRPASGNARAGSRVFTSGHHVVDGLCAAAKSTSLFDVETGSGGVGEINALARGGDYGWPTPTAASRKPLAAVPQADPSPGGCALQGNRVWISSLDGKALISAPLSGSAAAPKLGKFTEVLKNKYGRLRTVFAAPDGALWLTTDNREGNGRPIADDERVIRYVPTANGGNGNPV